MSKFVRSKAFKFNQYIYCIELTKLGIPHIHLLVTFDTYWDKSKFDRLTAGLAPNKKVQVLQSYDDKYKYFRYILKVNDPSHAKFDVNVQEVLNNFIRIKNIRHIYKQGFDG